MFTASMFIVENQKHLNNARRGAISYFGSNYYKYSIGLTLVDQQEKDNCWSNRVSCRLKTVKNRQSIQNSILAIISQ